MALDCGHSPELRVCVAYASLNPRITGREPPTAAPASACGGDLPARISLAMVGAAILSMDVDAVDAAGWDGEGLVARSPLLPGEGDTCGRLRLLPNGMAT